MSTIENFADPHTPKVDYKAGFGLIVMETQYLDILQELLEAPVRNTRNARVHSLFMRHITCDLRPFPLMTTKRVFFRGVVEELSWFLRGSTNARELSDRGVHIWDANADADGECGPIYGKQWRDFGGVDQIKYIIENIRRDPHSRRHFLSAWNPPEMPKMALPPCHVSYQFYVDNDKRLHCATYQRSADIFLGVPFNIASAALLTYLIASECALDVGTLTLNMGDVHLYCCHEKAARTQLGRTPLPLPTLTVDTRDNALGDFVYEDVELENYRACARIKADMVP